MKRSLPKYLFGALMGVLCLKMNAQNLHSTPNCAGSVTSSLKFTTSPSGNGNVDWSPSGSLTQTYPNVDGLGTDFTFTISGNTASFRNNPGGGGAAPAVTNFYSGATDAVGLYTSGIGASNDITITIDIFPAISGELAFELFHINQSGSSGDGLTISATTTIGGTLFPAFTTPATPDYAITGPGTIDANNFSSVANGQLGVNFTTSDSINQVVIVWTDCSVCSEQVHGLAFGEFDFCSPANDQDNDGIPDFIDLDDDNDGIPDAMEVCGNLPENMDMDTLDISIQLDGYPDETSWELQTSGGTSLAIGGGYVRPADVGATITSRSIIPSDVATVFTIFDSFGDALVEVPAGSYSVFRNGILVVGPEVSNWGFSKTENLPAAIAPYEPFDCIGSDYALDDDGDGVLNYQDPDYCTLNSAGVCANLDSDGDGIIDPFDLDADGDGIPDIVEAGGVDTDGDGMVDDLSDIDSDGLVDDYDQESGGNAISVTDKDNDGVPDYLDLDSDNDGILDVVEVGGTDINNDGFQDGYDIDMDGFSDDVDGDVGNDGTAENTANSLVTTGPDTNGDGIPDSYANSVDFDGDGIPNYLDLDADNDGIVDYIESQGNSCYQVPSNTVDAKGVPVNFSSYVNCADNSMATTFGTIPNIDGDDADTAPDYLDLDADADGSFDFTEGINQNGDERAIDEYLTFGANFVPAGGSTASFDNSQDTDGDGIPDWLDNRPGVTGFNGAALPPFQDPGSSFYSDTDQDGIVDLLDIDNGGTTIGFPFDSNSDNDPDWRDIDNTINLPVELISFDAGWMNETDGQIQWVTQREERVSHFKLLRSLDGKEFEEVTSLPGAGTTQDRQEYGYVDHNLSEQGARIVYYQLEEVDLDGSIWKSQVEMLLMPETGKLTWEVFPNPFHDQIQLELYGESENVEVALYDAAMKQVWSDRITLAGEKTLQTSTSQLADGFYLLMIRYNGQSYHRKLIKN